MAGIVLVVVLCALWIGTRGALAYRYLQSVQTGASESISTVSRDPSAAAATLSRLAADTSEARELTSDPVWKLAERTPWIGPQLAAFRTIASSSDVLIRESLLPLAASTNGVSIDSLKPVDGHIDTSVLPDLVDPAQTAATRAGAAARAVQDINRTPLLGVVDSAVGQASTLFNQVAGSIDGLARTSQLLPNMLGQDGPRNYLLLVQNNAEWRSLGGLTGTAILLHTDAGKISLVDTQSATGLVRDLADPIVPLPAEVTKIYGTRPARYFHNLTQVPNFPVDGPIAREMYRSKTGVQVDGVIAVDPVVLSYLLETIGPVELPTGDSLTRENAVQFLLNEVYFRYSDPATQDKVFASAAGAVFEGLINGRGTMEGLLAALGRASEERRLLVWSADADEEAILEGTTLAGQLPVSDSRTARFGVFFNDGTGSKMSYYLKPTVTITSGSCGSVSDSGRDDLTLRVSLTNTAPADAATSLPEYITGGGAYGTKPGQANVISNIYLPQGSTLVAASTGDNAAFQKDDYEGRQVLTFGTDLSPGATTEITVVARMSSTPTGAQALITPTADSSRSPTVTTSCRLN
ncbi:DUF4012 domain-containing protein [Microbacterium sp. Kw_RZR3]|uniref:DUF4012 domain-containing protein n=1 Tax=Microbacterium sp. Kw_RZR3 TaxID=3032903 RepID=UPI0023D9CEC7|nr:DUF4012 domain-containing protein [Microbacterium sp. Kw_RZR3]MDF2045931.1 DUF4012 domain-containing protein [Microbacterium sp. Kw_RZR3]